MNSNADQNEGPIAKKTIGTFFYQRQAVKDENKKPRAITKDQGTQVKAKTHGPRAKAKDQTR